MEPTPTAGETTMGDECHVPDMTFVTREDSPLDVKVQMYSPIRIHETSMDMMVMERPSMDELNLLYADVCQALGDPRRLNIIYALHERPRHVSQLAADLQMPQPTVSRHLQMLRDRHLVIAERDGAAVVYHLAEPQVIEVLDRMRLILRDSLARRAGLVDAEK